MAGSVIVRFGKGNGGISKAISRVTGSLFSHVEFGTSRGTWIGAHWEDGIQERPANYWTTSLERVYNIPCSLEDQVKLEKWMADHIGNQYNLVDIAGLLVQNRQWTTPKRFICSQFVADGLLMLFGPARVLNCQNDWTYRITPETLHLSPIFVRPNGWLIFKKG